MNQHNHKLIRGGQGRSDQDVADNAFAICVIGVILIVLGLVLGLVVYGGAP